MTALLQEHGQAMVQALLNACIFSLPTYMQPESADVIYELMLIDRPVSSLNGLSGFVGFFFVVVTKSFCHYSHIFFSLFVAG